MARDVQGSNIYTMKAGVIDKNPISSFWCNNNMNDVNVRKQLFYRLVRRSFIRRLRGQGPILFLCFVLGQETHLSKGLFPPRITKWVPTHFQWNDWPRKRGVGVDEIHNDVSSGSLGHKPWITWFVRWVFG